MKFIKNFSELGKNDASIAGGKGAPLGEMTQAGIPVPPGYVILANAFEQFIDETDINIEIEAILKKVDSREVHTVEDASEKIQTLIKEAKMPGDLKKNILIEFEKLGAKYVAVRSSATAEDSSSAAWAGQLDSFLNTEKDNLLDNVQRCWASLFTPRAIVYRFEKGLHKTKISVAVVVQKMVESEQSGVAFSVHPVTQDTNQIIIEASYGLGEAIVSGQVTPDSYVIHKNDWTILDKNIYTQTRGIFRSLKGGNEWRNLSEKIAKHQVLTDKEIVELAKIIKQIENHYGFPCDIEFAKEKNQFYIVQSRPITTLLSKQPALESNESRFDEGSISWAKDFLKNNPLDIKEACFSISLGEIVFLAYSSPNIFGDDYSPIFVPFSNHKGQQIISEKKMKLVERNIWSKAISNKKEFVKTLNEANALQNKMDSIKISKDELKKMSTIELHNYFLTLIDLMKNWWKYSSIGEDKGLIVEEKLVPLLMKNHSISGQDAFEYVSDMSMPNEVSVFSKERMAFLELCIKLKKKPDLINKNNKDFLKEVENYSKKYFYARTNFYEVISLEQKNLLKILLKTCSDTTLESLTDEYL